MVEVVLAVVVAVMGVEVAVIGNVGSAVEVDRWPAKATADNEKQKL